jgi:hypothetical protein
MSSVSADKVTHVGPIVNLLDATSTASALAPDVNAEIAHVVRAGDRRAGVVALDGPSSVSICCVGADGVCAAGRGIGLNDGGPSKTRVGCDVGEDGVTTVGGVSVDLTGCLDRASCLSNSGVAIQCRT